MKPATRSSLRVTAVAFVLMSVAFLGLSAPLYYTQVKVLRTWPAAVATVVRSDVVPVKAVSGEMLYDARLVLAIEANGQSIVATVNSNRQSTDYSRKLREVERFPAGRTQTILYNPAHPSDVRIQPGYNLQFFAMPALISGTGVLFAVLAVVLWAIARKRNKDPEARLVMANIA